VGIIVRQIFACPAYLLAQLARLISHAFPVFQITI
jgi:hypothetical protein